jgi:hypothetical protein
MSVSLGGSNLTADAPIVRTLRWDMILSVHRLFPITPPPRS